MSTDQTSSTGVGFTTGTGIGGGYGPQGKFPNPFDDVSNQLLPNDIYKVFDWAEYIYNRFGVYGAASRRVVRYFVTDIELEGESESEREMFLKFLNDDLKLKRELAYIGDEFMTYRNAFISVVFPFDRMFKCPDCKILLSAKNQKTKFSINDGTFSGTCVFCKKPVTFSHVDSHSPDRSRITIKRWNVKEIWLRWHPVSNRTLIYWCIPKNIIEQIRNGDNFIIDDTPWDILKAISEDANKDGPIYFEFKKDAVYHLTESALSGLAVNGWGIPPVLLHFAQICHIQTLLRADEAIALDYTLLRRIIFPKGGGNEDPLAEQSSAVFVAQVTALLDRMRNDPTLVGVAPRELGYQAMGGEAKAITPKEQLMLATDELLNSFGFPAELYRGTLTLQAMPAALRLFENSWGTLVQGLNDAARWVIETVSRRFLWGSITGKLQTVRLADNMERQALLLQGAAGQQIALGTAWAPFGIKPVEEKKKMLQEQLAMAKLDQEAQAKIEAEKSLSGATPAEGDPSMAPSPGDLMAQADQLAQSLLFETPDNLRRGELMKIKASNPTLHALVMQRMDETRREANRQGGAQVMEQTKAEVQQNPGAGQGMEAQASAPILGDVSALLKEALFSYTATDIGHLIVAAQNNVAGAKPALSWFQEVCQGTREL